MISCKVCDNEEYLGTIFCSECGSELLAEAAFDADTIVYPRKEDDPKYVTIPHPENGLPGDRITFYLPDYDQFLEIPDQNEFTLGRYVKDQVITPDVDLDPFDGFDNGISRLHATIRINPDRQTVHVVDLGSANGTRVNGYEIPSNSEVPLGHEDILTLGKLHIKVLLPNKSQKNGK